jgi:hypothetical protein
MFHVAEQTFGELAFMLVVPEEQEPIDEQAPVWGYAARVAFAGPFQGEVYAAITEEMLRPLAANMLGIDIDESPPDGVKLEDALKELLNVVVGNLLPAIAGNEVVFHIGGPEVLPEPRMPATVTGHEFIGQTRLDLDSGKALLRLFVDENAEIPGLCGGA